MDGDGGVDGGERWVSLGCGAAGVTIRLRHLRQMSWVGGGCCGSKQGCVDRY